MRCLLQELAFSKFKIQEKDTDEYKEHFFDELRDLVLPAHHLLDPANFAIETPQDPRFRLAQGMGKFTQVVCEVCPIYFTGFQTLKESSHTLTTYEL